MPRLTEQEQQVIVRYVEADKPLPDRFPFLLLEDKREVELVWNGKANKVRSVVVPFQVIEQVDEPRAEEPEDAELQLGLFDTRGRQVRGWTNKPIPGDSRLVLSSLRNGPMRGEIEAQGGLELIRIDPPLDCLVRTHVWVTDSGGIRDSRGDEQTVLGYECVSYGELQDLVEMFKGQLDDVFRKAWKAFAAGTKHAPTTGP